MMNGELQKQSEFPVWIKASIIEEAKKAMGTSCDADAIGLIVAISQLLDTTGITRSTG
jgi:hypothetical protein